MAGYSYCISLRLDHPSRDPDEFTAALGMEPDRVWRAGEPHATRKDGPLEGLRHESFWTATMAEGAWPPRELGDSLSGVLDRLEDKASFFAELSRSGGNAEFFIGWFIDGGNRGDILEHGLLGRLARLGLDLSFDIYPGDAARP